MRKLTTILILCTAMNAAYAGSAANNCGQLHLQISNLTKEACVLVNHTVVHGNLITSPPLSILPNDSKRFDMIQSGFGPSVTLTYQCGAEVITFNSQQNACVFAAGSITATIIEPAPAHIKGLYEAIEGSSFWDRPGMINWNFINTN